MFKNPEIDAVIICVPTYIHAKIAIEAAEAKNHIFYEKSMARTSKDAQEMINAAKENSVKLIIGLLKTSMRKKIHPVHNISRIGLSIHIESDLTWKANMRTFEILASGTLLLTDNIEVVEEYFTSVKEIDTWNTSDELIEKVDYYLNLLIEDVLPIIERCH